MKCSGRLMTGTVPRNSSIGAKSGFAITLCRKKIVFYYRDFLTFAACLPKAVRVFFGKRFKVCFRFAALAAFLMFFRAALRCR
jgi:hypothetical protein